MLEACGGDPQPGHCNQVIATKSPQSRHGEEDMKQIGLAFALSTLLFSTLAANAQTPSWVPPPDNERCPSKWGAGDERGAGNHVKPQSVLNALKLVKTGEIGRASCRERV